MPSTHTTTYNIFTQPANVQTQIPSPPLPRKRREVPSVDPAAVADGLYEDDSFNAILDAFSRTRANSDSSNRTVFRISEEGSESDVDSEQDAGNDSAPVQDDRQHPASPADDTQR